MKVFITISLLLTLATSLTLAGVLSSSAAKPLCGGSSSSKTIQLLNPNVPPRECTYKIDAYSKSVCQLRIEMTYTLAQPSVPGQGNTLKYATCDQDYFEAGDLRLCGVEEDQHIYLPFNRTDGVTSVALKMVLAHRAGSHDLPTAEWNIQITQLECPAGASVRSAAPEGRASTIKDGFFVAPPGCLQYFPQETGTVTSFNYNDGQGVYPGNMNYAICFRRTTETVALVLTSNFFELGTDATHYEEGDESCYDDGNADYLMVPQGKIERQNKRATYFCGDSLMEKTVSSSNPGPLMVLFNSDESYEHEHGFSFDYTVTD